MRSHRDLSRRLTRLELCRKADQDPQGQSDTYLEFQAFLISERGQFMLEALSPERREQLRQADSFCDEDYQRIAEAKLEAWRQARGFAGLDKHLLRSN